MNRLILSCALGIASFGAIADELDLAALTCAADASVDARWKEWERAGRKTGDGSFVLDGPFTADSLCVEHVSVAGAFGVLTVFATVCDAKPEPLLAFVRSRYPALQPSKDFASEAKGVIAAYASEKRTFMLFNGRVNSTTPPDPKSKEVSYLCTYRASGPQ